MYENSAEDNIWTAIIESNGITDMLNRIEYVLSLIHIQMCIRDRTNTGGYNQLPGTNWYYESQFVDSMPDLNLQSEAVRGEIDKITSFQMCIRDRC